jgi:hypothetical protein
MMPRQGAWVWPEGCSVTDHVNKRRRESDRAEERADRAAKLGDFAGFVVASGQAEAARRRRAEWADREPEESPTTAAG